MRNFTTEDFSGAGQYLVRLGGVETEERKLDRFINVKDTGYLSTIMYKVGYDHNNLEIGTGQQITLLISMADGWTRSFHYHKDSKDTPIDYDNKVIWQGEEIGDNGGKRKFVDYLNNPILSQEYRFATQEEVVRVVMYQSSRWRN